MFYNSPTSKRRTLLRGVCLLVFPLLVSSVACAQTPARWRLSAWQRSVSEQKQTLVYVDTHAQRQAGERRTTVRVTRTTSQMSVVLDLDNGTDSEGSTRWKATIKQIKFSEREEVSPPDNFMADMMRDVQKEQQALEVVVQGITKRLNGLPIQIVQGKDGHVFKVDVAALYRKIQSEVQSVPVARRVSVRSRFGAVLNEKWWKELLDARTPTTPPSQTVGTQWSYVPVNLSPLKAPPGTAQIESVQGEGEALQINVASVRSVDIEGKPEPKLDSAQYVLDYHSALKANTRFGLGTLWPLEHSALERGRALWRIFDVNKQKQISLLDTTPTDFTVENRLTMQPLDATP